MHHQQTIPGVQPTFSLPSGLLSGLLLLSLAILLPTAVFYVFVTSSQAPGLGLSSILIIGLGAIGMIQGQTLKQWTVTLVATGFFALIVAIHALVAYLFEPVEMGRMIGSLALFCLTILGGVALSRSLFQLGDDGLSRAIALIVAAFFIIGILGILQIQPPNVGGYFKRVFPFTEPSHYSLSFTPLLLAVCVNTNLVVRSLILVAALVVAYLIESLSLVAGTIIVGLICLPAIWSFAAGGLVFLLVGVLDVSYFADRLELTQSSGNLSVLVYIQGWDLMADGLRRTFGWGLGFQQLGVGAITTYTSSLITALAGNDVNLRDGGFTMAKIVGEFGVFGIALIAAYVVVLFRCIVQLRKIAMRRIPASAGHILALSFVCAYAIEAFIRGIGYFSGTAMLTLAALCFLARSRVSAQRTLKPILIARP